LSKGEKYLLEKLLKKQLKLLPTDNSASEKLEELKESLSEKLSDEELKVLLDKQKGIVKLERHLIKLQKNKLEAKIEIK